MGTGPFPDPDIVMALLLQTDIQAMMQEEGVAAQTVSKPASPPAGGDKTAMNQNQERHISLNRSSNLGNQSSSDARTSGGSTGRQSRLPPTSKRKDPESKPSNLWILSSPGSLML